MRPYNLAAPLSIPGCGRRVAVGARQRGGVGSHGTRAAVNTPTAELGGGLYTRCPTVGRRRHGTIRVGSVDAPPPPSTPRRTNNPSRKLPACLSAGRTGRSGRSGRPAASRVRQDSGVEYRSDTDCSGQVGSAVRTVLGTGVQNRSPIANQAGGAEFEICFIIK